MLKHLAGLLLLSTFCSSQDLQQNRQEKAYQGELGFPIRKTSLADESSDITRRTPIDWCLENTPQTIGCISGLLLGAGQVYNIATDIYDRVKTKNCNPIINNVDGYWYKYHAEDSCDTTAIIQTLEGALTKALMDEKRTCNPKCIGKWKCYLLLGTDYETIRDGECGKSEEQTYCGGVGNNDLPPEISKDTGEYTG